MSFSLSIKTILNIEGNTLPFAGIILGPPSSLKTAVIDLFRKWPQTYYTDNFSAKAFVSHSTAASKEQLSQIDMLPRIKNKLFLTPELAPMFSARDEDLIQLLGIMIRVLDGHGYESDTGSHGHRGYDEQIMFTWSGAAVEIPYKVYKYLGTLGPKLYFLRIPLSKESEDKYVNQINDDHTIKINAIRDALVEYLIWFEVGPTMIMQNDIPKMGWNIGMDEGPVKHHIVRMAELLAHLRGVVPTWEKHDGDGSDYNYSLATIEDPSRAITQLRNLARGHALSQGRNYLCSHDASLLVKVVMSTASRERVTIFDLLIRNGGNLSTSEITAALNVSNPTARSTMAEFTALGIVEMSQDKDDPLNAEKSITLNQEFNWFLTDEFVNLSAGTNKEGQETLLKDFCPPCTTIFEKEQLKEICPPSNIIFPNELKPETPNTVENDNKK